MMAKPDNYFAWCHRLQCPPSICNDGVKKILRKGLMELLWDDIGNTVHPAKRVTLIRKNILLHKLRHNVSDKTISSIKSRSQLRSDRNKLEGQISKMEEKYEEQDFLTRQKAQKLKDIRSMRSLQRVRKDLLRMKHNETATQLQDCVNMRLVCERLMPRASKELDSEAVREMLNVVMTLCSGASKREVWGKISAAFNTIETSTLWLHMYQTLLEDVNKLTKAEVGQASDSSQTEESIDVEIARVCGQHVCIVLNRYLHDGRANNIQQSIMELIEQVEAASDDPLAIGNWLFLALEVRKMEIEQTSYQKEIDSMQETINDNNTLTFDIVQLTSGIENIHLEIEQCVQDIQQSLVFLKSSTTLINKMKEKLHWVLERMIALRANEYDSSWLKDDLDTELDIFFEGFDINALRKIMLKGDIGSYRHTKCCFSEASVHLTSSQGMNVKPYFPMVQVPVYYLIECWKHLTAAIAYKRLEAQKPEELSDSLETPIEVPEAVEYNTVELLNSTRTACDRTRSEIEQFNRTLNAWSSQSVQKAMEITEKTIDDVPFRDWSQRYGVLLYMLQNAAQ